MTLGEKDLYVRINYLILPLTILLIMFLSFLMRTMIMDDAYIALRYADNLLSGEGLVFNPGERIEGIVNTGWILFIIPFIHILGPVLAVKILGFILVFITLYLLYKISSVFEENQLDIIPILIILLSSTQLDYILFSFIGMETALMSSLLFIIVWMVLKNKSMIWIAIICSFLFLVHPEGILVYPLARFFLIFTGDAWKRMIKADFIYLILIFLYSFARFLYYGSFIPNTFYAKGSSFKTILTNLYQIGTEMSTAFPTLFSSIFVLIIMAFGIFSIFRIHKQTAAFMGAIVLAGYGFSVYAPTDWSGMARYFAPYIPLAILVMWRGISFLLISLEGKFSWIKKFQKVIIIGLFLAMIIPSFARIDYFLKPENIEQYPGFVLSSQSLLEPIDWIKENTSPDSIIACRRIGALAFYSKRYIFDHIFGLTDPTIARGDGSTIALIIDATIGEHWRRKSPDYYLEDRFRIELLLSLTGETESSFHIQGIEYSLIKSFVIGKHPDGSDIEWCLCKKIEDRSDL